MIQPGSLAIGLDCFLHHKQTTPECGFKQAEIIRRFVYFFGADLSAIAMFIYAELREKMCQVLRQMLQISQM